ncbi:MAG TPA: hypothetical protein VEP89_04945 [Draconibacterium sp.]|nr:hypothetical protein [Draconibacterium sp.]
MILELHTTELYKAIDNFTYDKVKGGYNVKFWCKGHVRRIELWRTVEEKLCLKEDDFILTGETEMFLPKWQDPTKSYQRRQKDRLKYLRKQHENTIS